MCLTQFSLLYGRVSCYRFSPPLAFRVLPAVLGAQSESLSFCYCRVIKCSFGRSVYLPDSACHISSSPSSTYLSYLPSGVIDLRFRKHPPPPSYQHELSPSWICVPLSHSFIQAKSHEATAATGRGNLWTFQLYVLSQSWARLPLY